MEIEWKSMEIAYFTLSSTHGVNNLHVNGSRKMFSGHTVAPKLNPSITFFVQMTSC